MVSIATEPATTIVKALSFEFPLAVIVIVTLYIHHDQARSIALSRTLTVLHHYADYHDYY